MTTTTKNTSTTLTFTSIARPAAAAPAKPSTTPVIVFKSLLASLAILGCLLPSTARADSTPVDTTVLVCGASRPLDQGSGSVQVCRVVHIHVEHGHKSGAR